MENGKVIVVEVLKAVLPPKGNKNKCMRVCGNSCDNKMRAVKNEELLPLLHNVERIPFLSSSMQVTQG